MQVLMRTNELQHTFSITPPCSIVILPPVFTGTNPTPDTYLVRLNTGDWFTRRRA